MDADYSQAATALLTEHLQYTPLSLIDDVIDSVNNFVYQGIGSLEAGLFATPPERLGFKGDKPTEGSTEEEREYPEAKKEIEEGLHKLETLLNSTVDKNFDKFEIYVLRNILCVPADLAPWMRLSHYEGLNSAVPPTAPTAESIQLLRRKLAASRNVSRALQTERDRNKALLIQLQDLLNPQANVETRPNLSFLSQTRESYAFSSQQPLTTNTNFTLSQLPALKSLLAELRTKMDALKDVQSGVNTAKDELREERREYIEQRTKKHLDRSGQASTEDAGPIHGKIVEPHEIEALERIAGTFNPH